MTDKQINKINPNDWLEPYKPIPACEIKDCDHLVYVGNDVYGCRIAEDGLVCDDFNNDDECCMYRQLEYYKEALKNKEEECKALRKDIKDIANLLDLDTGEEYNFGNIELEIKQLKVKEQEYEELRQYHNKCCEEFEKEKKEWLGKYNQVSRDFYNGKYCNKENCNLLKTKEQECERLKNEQRCAWKSLEGTFCPEAQQELDQLKAENILFRESNINLAKKNDELKKVNNHIENNRKQKADKLMRIEKLIIACSTGYTDELIQELLVILHEPEPSSFENKYKTILVEIKDIVKKCIKTNDSTYNPSIQITARAILSEEILKKISE